MGGSLPALESYLIDQGILSTGELDRFASQTPGGVVSALGETLARFGTLTAHQVECVRAGRTHQLVYDDYVVLGSLGAGSQANVLKAFHLVLRRIDALKVLRPELLQGKDSRMRGDAEGRFRQGVRIAAQLEHPNVVRTYSFGRCDGTLYIATEYVDGQNLDELAQLTKGLRPADALHYTLQTARGLAYAHGKRIIHRDIKPSNLLLDKHSATVKIIDTGLARIEGNEETRITAPQYMMGSAICMSPEQASDSRCADYRSDIYSLGCTLYMLLTARPIYDQPTVTLMLLAHETQPIPRLAVEGVEIPEGLEEVFRNMVAKEPRDRYPSMDAVIEALLPYCSATPARAVPVEA
jgi:serine/threonine protein kinase